MFSTEGQILVWEVVWISFCNYHVCNVPHQATASASWTWQSPAAAWTGIRAQGAAGLSGIGIGCLYTLWLLLWFYASRMSSLFVLLVLDRCTWHFSFPRTTSSSHRLPAAHLPQFIVAFRCSFWDLARTLPFLFPLCASAWIVWFSCCDPWHPETSRTSSPSSFGGDWPEFCLSPSLIWSISSQISPAFFHAKVALWESWPLSHMTEDAYHSWSLAPHWPWTPGLSSNPLNVRWAFCSVRPIDWRFSDLWNPKSLSIASFTSRTLDSSEMSWSSKTVSIVWTGTCFGLVSKSLPSWSQKRLSLFYLDFFRQTSGQIISILSSAFFPCAAPGAGAEREKYSAYRGTYSRDKRSFSAVLDLLWAEYSLQCSEEAWMSTSQDLCSYPESFARLNSSILFFDQALNWAGALRSLLSDASLWIDCRLQVCHELTRSCVPRFCDPQAYY